MQGLVRKLGSSEVQSVTLAAYLRFSSWAVRLGGRPVCGTCRFARPLVCPDLDPCLRVGHLADPLSDHLADHLVVPRNGTPVGHLGHGFCRRGSTCHPFPCRSPSSCRSPGPSRSAPSCEDVRCVRSHVGDRRPLGGAGQTCPLGGAGRTCRRSPCLCLLSLSRRSRSRQG